MTTANDEYGIDERSGEYKNDITGCVRSAIDFLETKGLSVEKSWLELQLTPEYCAYAIKLKRPALAGQPIAGHAIRNGLTKVL